MDYDLLNHDYIAHELYRSISYCWAEQSYVFGLEGKWGSGKTTIINKVRRMLENNAEKNRISILSDFDPWLYGNQESMLVALYEKILKETGIKFNNRISKFADELKSILTNNNNTGKIVGSIIFDKKTESERITEVRAELCDYLQSCDKRFILFIDNIDRADADKVIFLLRIIATYFDLPRIIYVLLYDRERICKILRDQKQIDPRFLDKIVQIEHKVPMCTPFRRGEIYTRSIQNMLKSAGVSDEELKDFDSIIDYIIKNTEDLRAFKRLINSVFTAGFIWNNSLSIRDQLAIETIHFYDDIVNDINIFTKRTNKGKPAYRSA